MWTYVIAFTADLKGFMMVRSRKRGGWEMPGGRALEGETPLEASVREFREETGHELISRPEWVAPIGKGFVHFGYIGKGDEHQHIEEEIAEVGIFESLPPDLAYPMEEYEPLLSRARSHLLGVARRERP
ncbi:MAG: NUDIX domain-containing protein [Candidatus Thermoplasmatota archaeon]|nr:NUDIX domain-containing protein [Candidatus Thermoplasmatota archaeon]